VIEMKMVFCVLTLATLCAAQKIDVAKSKALGGTAEMTTYKGRKALHVTPPPAERNAAAMAQLEGVEFENGVIEADVVGMPVKGASEGARGFVGIAFRVDGEANRYELIYIRPLNGRAHDQLQRNHSTQYMSVPDFPWKKLREQSPGVYESYVDLEPGAWTHLRIVVRGQEAELYVGDAKQPCLVVHDLKLGKRGGRVALWAGSEADGYFTNVKIANE
jgi:hypothetical protein